MYIFIPIYIYRFLYIYTFFICKPPGANLYIPYWHLQYRELLLARAGLFSKIRWKRDRETLRKIDSCYQSRPLGSLAVSH